MNSARTCFRSVRPRFRHAVRTAAVAAAGVLLAACGSGSGSGGGHNDADVHFAQDMIPHHRQTMVMSEIAVGNASSPAKASAEEVRALAEELLQAQQPEIDTMTGWLESWEEEVPPGMSGVDQGHHGGVAPAPGMMSQERMEELVAATGDSFDTRFLTMMTEHHEGALEIARAERDQGDYGPARELAQDIIDSRTDELTRMRELLEDLS
ncbi:DUF305 domain-containing protein [Streptomyces aidingensis]|uniref:Uncharacterized conserved protein, DUF305 family n=1 Tax=Streptomyces aidingensis TaxID=910347 RepID=A0A1I1T249_9ACTN|nr:DUF305 domain-containing protein [Streptomyces aidingensis]SFD52764.1 Uncharacterized conserved protein, DUF305 family [Streptomyces aidingensis]